LFLVAASSKTAPFQRAKHAAGCLPHFPEAHFLYFTARSAFQTMPEVGVRFLCPARPQLDSIQKKPHLRSTSAPLYTRRSYVTMERAKERKDLPKWNANRKTIQTLRRQMGRRRKLAEAVGVTAAAVSKWETASATGYSAAVPSGAGVGHHTRHLLDFRPLLSEEN
jgi:DNA-binding transcriptional regulator YiaG